MVNKKPRTKKARAIAKKDTQVTISAMSIVISIVLFAVSAWAGSKGCGNTSYMFMVFGVIWAITAVAPIMISDRFFLTLITIGLLFAGYFITQSIMVDAMDELFELIINTMLGSIDFGNLPIP